jgi:uncharacterized protein YjbI with pentapeptide repeats
MANDEHVAILKQDVAAWNAWRTANPDILPDLEGADLSETDLSWAKLMWGDLRNANLSGANLEGVYLHRAKLSGANLSGAFTGATLTRTEWLKKVTEQVKDVRSEWVKNELATMRSRIIGTESLNWLWPIVNVPRADLSWADLSGANLKGVDLSWANLNGADLSWADLSGANLKGVDLTWANLKGANLREVDLQVAVLVSADFTGADLTGCRVHGVSAWDLKLETTKQQNLIITRADEPTITVDNIEVAQFVYLLLHNPKIRDVIDTIGRKAVLILGRFTAERKVVLDALREELRKRGYVPILFDFDKPVSQDLTATVSTLAHLARFIIADLTDPRSIPYELATVVPTTPVPVQPILLSGSSEFAMFQDLRRRHHWVLTTHRYASQEQLIADLGEKVIRPAELKVLDLQGST